MNKFISDGIDVNRGKKLKKYWVLGKKVFQCSALSIAFIFVLQIINNSIYPLGAILLKKMVVQVNEMDSKIYVSIRNVSFKYPNSEEKAIKEISEHFYSGEKIAIVGDNGSGKSTLINLLLGVFRPNNGDILINGHKLQDVLQQYLNLTVCLLQNYVKYQFSAEDNIIIGNGGMQDKTIKNNEALYEIVKRLPRGKMTILGQLDENGIDLSGGEWQQIALLRTFYKKIFDLVILDEPFSNVDPIKSEEILNKIFNDVADKLFIIITHNMGHAKKCDRIIVLKEGKIIEEGTHKILMEKKGHYYELYQSQEERYSESV